MARDSSATNEPTLHANLRTVDYARTAFTLGICALLGNYCFVAFVYVSSQLAENAYAMKFWIKSLVRFPLNSTLGFAFVLVPSLLLVSLIAPRLLSKVKTRHSRMMMFATLTLFTHLTLTVVWQLAFGRRIAIETQSLVLLSIYLGIGTAVGILMSRRRNESSSVATMHNDSDG